LILQRIEITGFLGSFNTKRNGRANADQVGKAISIFYALSLPKI